MWSPLKVLAEELPVKPMSSSCDCDARHLGKDRAIVHAEGWHVTCLACGSQWVEWRGQACTSAAPAATNGKAP